MQHNQGFSLNGLTYLVLAGDCVFKFHFAIVSLVFVSYAIVALNGHIYIVFTGPILAHLEGFFSSHYL